MRIKTLLTILLVTAQSALGATNSPITNGILMTNLNANGKAITGLPSLTVTSDNAYGAGWNGSLRLATENAVYDKIQTLSSLTFDPPLVRVGDTISLGVTAHGNFMVGPISGGGAAPTFRQMVNSDLPTAFSGQSLNGITLAAATAPGTRDTGTPDVTGVVNSITHTKVNYATSGGIELRTTAPGIIATFNQSGIVQMVSGGIKVTSDDTKASASTLALGSAIGIQYQITGTTDINLITGVGVGEERILRFTGALFLNPSANLLLPGGAVIRASAGSVAFLLGKPGGVVQVTRFYNSEGGSQVADIDGGIIKNVNISRSTLSIASVASAYDLSIIAGDSLTGGKTLTIYTADSDRLLNLGGNLNIAGNLTTSGTSDFTLTTTATTNSTFPAGTHTLLARDSYSTTATTFGTTTLTVASEYQQFFTGNVSQTVTLPVASTLTLGFNFHIVNNSVGQVTVNSSGGNAVIVLTGKTSAIVTCVLTSGTTAASWNVGTNSYPLTIYAAGTAYTLDGTATALDFGTTDPVLTIDQAGTYLISARVVVNVAPAGTSAGGAVTFNVRRTNNTPASISNSLTSITTVNNRDYDDGKVISLPGVIYTTALTNDSITIFGNDTSFGGDRTVTEASIVAIRLY